jgi:hypothetical protein
MVARCLTQIGELAADEPLCLGRQLSAKILGLLRSCGCDDDFLDAAGQDQSDHPDRDGDGKPLYDLGAYVLRRDWASRGRNICGLSAIEIDYLMGHKIKLAKKAREDYRLPEHQTAISHKLEHYVADPAISRHPGCAPIMVAHGSDLELIPFDCYRIVNNCAEPLMMHLDLEANEGAEPIKITAPVNSVQATTRRTRNTNCQRTAHPIIGQSHI